MNRKTAKSPIAMNIDRFWKWRPTEGQIMGMTITFIHLLCVFAPFTFTRTAFRVGAGLVIFTGLFGLSLSYHRNLTHRSFDLPKWLEYFFAYIGVLVGQRDPIFWVSIHRYHHQFVDTERDPHSPVLGNWFSEMGWLFTGDYSTHTNEDRKNVEDLKKQPFYMFLNRTYYWHLFAFGAVLYAFGGFPFFIWAWGVRMVVSYQATFLLNLICHQWGKQAWNTGDLSTNHVLMALLTFGEGWHNNHHAFEFSARLGLEWWQFDPTWQVIRFLEAIGLATNVKVPTEAQKKKRSFSPSVQ